MGHFSMEKSVPAGSTLSGNQHLGLWLLETLDELEAAEAALTDSKPSPARRKVERQTGGEPATAERELSYEQFVAGRRLRSQIEGAGRNSLAGSYVSHVRGFLNRLLGIGSTEAGEREDEADQHRAAFDRGDETESAEESLEAGGDFSPPLLHQHQTGETDSERATRTAHQRRANRDYLIEAVTDLSESVATKAADGGLRSIDILRLRAMLMIITSAAWNGDQLPKNALQVLPAEKDTEGAWPRVLGRVLFAYFGGKRSAVATLVLDDVDERIPADILECWVTCMWAIQVSIAGASRHREYQTIARALESLRMTLYRTIALRVEEVESARVLGMFEALSKRFGSGLGMDGDAILAAHRQMARMLFSEASV